MWTRLHDAGTRRLCVAAGLSVALHGTIAVSVQRYPGSGGASPLTSERAAPPLIARLVTAVTDSALSTAIPVVPPPAEAAIQNQPPGAVSLTTQARVAPAGAGSTYYFKASELDRRPYPLFRIEVPPPESTAVDSGMVIIRLRISERGRVEDAKIITGTGAAEFEAAALREFSRADFRPGYRGNLPVRSEMLIEVTLHPPDSMIKPQMVGADSAQN